MSEWLTDTGGPGFAHTYEVAEELYRGRSDFQEIRVVRNRDFGVMLVLDDAVQTTERDEFIYHEMLAHVPLLAHPSPRRVLIIGGGDGGLLEEALKHPLEAAVMVEIDRQVIDVTRRFLPDIPRAAFEDRRTRLIIADGIRYLAETEERFDVILVDSTDPKGPAVGLFAQPFYAAARRCLTPGGLIAVQSGSPLYQQDLIGMVRGNLGPVFPRIVTYLAGVPSYPGVLWTFTLGITGDGPILPPADAIGRRTAGFGLQYLTPGILRAAFELPPYIARGLGITTQATEAV